VINNALTSRSRVVAKEAGRGRKYPPFLGGYFHTAGIAVPHLIIFSRQLDVSESFSESICKLSWPPLQPEERRRADVAKIAADGNARSGAGGAHRHLQPLATRASARARAPRTKGEPLFFLSARVSHLSPFNYPARAMASPTSRPRSPPS